LVYSFLEFKPNLFVFGALNRKAGFKHAINLGDVLALAILKCEPSVLDLVFVLEIDAA